MNFELQWFNHRVKKKIFEDQGECCQVCGRKVPLESHHCVPIKGLRRQGIKGTNSENNCVGVCGKKGGGQDCHELLDIVALQGKLFWNGDKFVPLSEMPKDTYVFYDIPKPRCTKHR